MTCRLAFSYNREIYALPGRADDICSQGCNELIREKIAEPITSISSLTMSLGLNSYARNDNSHCKKLISRYSERLPETDINIITNILQLVCKERGITIEEISIRIGIPYAKASELTGILEIDGFLSTDLLQRCSINAKNM